MFLVNCLDSQWAEHNGHALAATALLCSRCRADEEPTIFHQLFSAYTPCLLQACCKGTSFAQHRYQLTLARGGLETTAVL